MRSSWPANVQRESVALGGQQIPPVYVGDVQTAQDADAVYGSGEVQLRRHVAVDAAGLAAHKLGQFAEASVGDGKVEIDAFRLYVPAAVEPERAQAGSGPVGAGELRRTIDLPSATDRDRRRDIEIGFGQIEGGLIVAEFEVDAAVAHLQRGKHAHHGRVDDGSEVPAAPFGSRAGFGQVDAGVFEAYGGDDKLAEEQSP